MVAVKVEAEMEIGKLFFQLFEQGIAEQYLQVGEVLVAGRGIEAAAGSHLAFDGFGITAAVCRPHSDTDLFIFGPLPLFEHVADVIFDHVEYFGVGGFHLHPTADVSAIELTDEGIHIRIGVKNFFVSFDNVATYFVFSSVFVIIDAVLLTRFPRVFARSVLYLLMKISLVLALARYFHGATLAEIKSIRGLIAPVLLFAYGIKPYWFSLLTVTVGEIISCGILGMILLFALQKHAGRIFSTQN